MRSFGARNGTGDGFCVLERARAGYPHKVHVAVVPGTDFGVPHDLRLAFCNDRYNEGIDRLHDYFSSANAVHEPQEASAA